MTTGHGPHCARRLRRPLHPLRHPRARHGRGHERHRAAWRLHSLWRHVPGLRRLCARRDAAVGADGPAGHLCHDARLDRPWRRRPDASADRASGDAARDAQHRCVPPGRYHRDGGMLGACAASTGPAERSGVVAPEPPDAAACPQRRQPFEPRRLCAARNCGAARHNAAGDRIGGGDRLSLPPTFFGAVQDRCGGRLDAVLGAVRGADPGLSPLVLGRGAAHRHRSRGRLGWDRWIGEKGAFIGMQGFGASAPAPDLYRHFGITPENSSPRRASSSTERNIDHGQDYLATIARSCCRHGYGVPAFNINNMEQGLAVMEAAAACDAPVICRRRGAHAPMPRI